MKITRDDEKKPPVFFLLSHSQRNIWNLEMAHPGLPMNNICTALRIDGNLNIDYLQTCIKLAYQAFPSLRIRVTVQEENPCQYIADEIPEHSDFFDFSETSIQGVDAWYQSLAREHFVLCDAPLCQMLIFKLSDNSGGILTRIHHIITDAWSHALVTNHIIHNYFQLLQGKETDSVPVPDYCLHIENEQKYLRSASYEKDLRYWKEQLVNLQPALAKEHQCAQISPVGIRKSYQLPNRLNRLIADYCTEKKVSPFAVYYMGLAVYLRRLRRQEKFCIGVPTINRLNYREKKSGGMFVNTLPFVNELNVEDTWNTFNERLKDDWFRLLYHQRLPFEDIKRIAASDETMAANQIFEIALSYQNGKMDHLRGAHVSLEGRWIYCGYQSETLCIHLSSRDEENRFVVDYDYLTQLFSEAEIDTLHRHLVRILKEALSHPDVPIAELSILTEEEEERVIFDFNQTDTWINDRENLADRLRQSGREHPCRVALICEGERITYAQLLAESECAARRIAHFTDGKEGTAAIMMDRTKQLFVALCAVILAGHSWLLLDKGQPEERLKYILEDSQALLLLTNENWEQIMEGEEAKELRGSELFDLAYLVYTSGTTGKPKAVEVEQRSVTNLAEAMRPLYPKGAVLSICNVMFDAFLLESVLALLNGATIIFANDEEMNHAEKIANLMMQYDAGFLALTPSRLSGYMKEPQFLRALPHLTTLICGGEVLPVQLYFKLRDYTSAVLYNQYGPSEATVAVSHSVIDGRGQVTIGSPLCNCRIYILDENQKALPVGTAGEIYIGGECLARGYHNQPQLTEERFVADPYLAGQRIYRTGDIGKWTPDGNIVYLGRNDQQVKVLGHRIELAEVEAILTGYSGIEQCVVQVQDNRLVAFYIGREPIEEEGVLAYGAKYLPRYLMPIAAKQLQVLPVTDNGKIDYRKLPKLELPENTEPPADETEEKLLAIWERILDREKLGVHSDYFLSGGDSLNAGFMLTEVEKVFQKNVSMQTFYKNSTVRRLGNYLRGRAISSKLSEITIERAKIREWYPASFVQTGFYVMHQMDESGKSYNMPGIFRVDGWPDFGRLEEAFRRMIREDESLRTGFLFRDGKLAGIIQEEAEFQLTWIDTQNVEEAFGEFVRPFDLARPPLLRAALVRNDKNEPFLFLDMHHIISDGISSQIFLQRLSAYYAQEEAELSELSYGDYAWWLQNQEQSRAEKSRTYWKSVLPAAVPENIFPTDRPRPSVFDGKGAVFGFTLPEELDAALFKFCRERQVTPYVLMLSVFGAMLSRFSRTEEVVVGSPFSGRQIPGLEKMTGVFVHSLPVFLNPEKEKTFEAYMEAVKQQVTGIIDHQDISMEELIAMTGSSRSRDRNPLYQVLFSLAPGNADGQRLGELGLTHLAQQETSVKMDLHLAVSVLEKHYSFQFEYAASLFDGVTIEFYSRCYLHFLRQALENPGKRIGELEALHPVDRYELLERPNRMRTPYDATTVEGMLDYHALLSPQKKAAVWGEGKSFTFTQMKERTDRLAMHLICQGIQRGDKVAFLTRRQGDMPVMMFGILKAGAAYVPVDPAFPIERIRYMLAQADVKLVIWDPALALMDELPCPLWLYTDAEPEQKAMLPVNDPEQEANVIFTSGSTGRPKGVIMVHKALSNLMEHLDPLLGEEEDRILCASNCVFDVFTTETILALGRGRSISIADEEEMMLPWKMAERIVKDSVTVLQLTPSRMLMCLNDSAFCQALGRIRIIILLGEPWTMELKDRLCALTCAKIFNIYGPTETSVHNCQGEIREEHSIHIGKPIGNCRYYLLDKERREVEPTAIGEIYIAGECLSNGYINQPELTEEVFVPDIHYPRERMYKTGDLGRLRADGNWQCLGRVDTQLKLNGHRIEPVEIATVMQQSGYAKEAAVVPIYEDGIPRFLRAVSVAGEGYEEQKLREYLAQRLPDYMVPSEFLVLEKLPRTSSGKTDLNALMKLEKTVSKAPVPESERSGEIEESEEKGNPLEKIWETVLGRRPDRTSSFFGQGGTSLTAIMILNQYHEKNLDFSLNDFYHHPTLEEQIKLLCGDEKAAEISLKTGKGETKTVQELPETVLEGVKRATAFTGVLVTGATGYLGSYIVKTLLEYGCRRICCVVRGEKERVEEVLKGYFGEAFWQSYGQFLSVYTGQVTEPDFGMEKEHYLELLEQVTLVYHCAADVRHFAPEEELLHTNVDGTAETLKFAEKAGAAFMHISTVSVAGEYLCELPQRKILFEESDLCIGQNWEENPYAKSKLLAEVQVLQGQERGIPVRIFRVGRLVGNSYSGAFQRNPQTNAYYRMMRGILEFGMLPKEAENLTMEVTCVDQAAEAIVRLSEESGGAFHICNPMEVSVLELARTCGNVQITGREAFEADLKACVKGSDSPYVQALAQSWFSGEFLPAKIHLSTRKTEEALRKTGFAWKRPDVEILSRSLLV